jgi:hypothetical protein
MIERLGFSYPGLLAMGEGAKREAT